MTLSKRDEKILIVDKNKKKKRGINMRVINAEYERVDFSDGSYMESHHVPDCCEYNYADFSVLAIDPELTKGEFESVSIVGKKEGTGVMLLFEGLPHRKLGTYNKKVLVPCYSEQNGWYSSNVTVKHYNKDGKQLGYAALKECKMLDE